MRNVLLLLAALLAPLSAHAGTTFIKQVKGGQGSMTYDLYVPDSYKASSAAVPLVVTLHGGYASTALTAQYSGWNALADQYGFLVAYPLEVRDNHYNGLWNWSDVARNGRSDRGASLIALIVTTVENDYRIDRARVLLHGISAGAGMAVGEAVVYPELYAAVGIEAGCAFGYWRCFGMPCHDGVCSSHVWDGLYFTAESSARAAYKAMGEHARRVPAIISYGDADGLSAAVGQPALLDMWLALNDWADDGARNHTIAPDPAWVHDGTDNGARYSRSLYNDANGCAVVEHTIIEGMPHMYSGARFPDGHTGPGPDMREEQYRFMIEQAGKTCGK